MRTIRIKAYKFDELSKDAKETAILQFNALYGSVLDKLRYAKEFTPHKVAVYENQLTEIVTRQNEMPNDYEFTKEGKLI